MERTFDFLGAEVSGEHGDRVAVIPGPVEWSASYGPGTARAPQAILDASMQIEF
jgi:arginase family enzyme